MTAEMAVLNKSAVALAADSAVTIGRPPNAKIYNTVDKIFELSAHHPVGIMVYGGLDFMGLPIETIIKEYRKKLGTQSFAHISEYRDHFREHLRNLETELPLDANDKTDHVAGLLFSALSRAHQDIRDIILKKVAADGFKKSKLNGYAQAYIRQETTKLRSEKFPPGFSKVTLQADYVALVDAVITETFKSLMPTEQTRGLVRKYAGYVLAKTPLSSQRTGVVIAGFGDEELCPTLERFELDGFVNDRLKYVDFDPVKIERRANEAEILGFAQEDMVATFVDGINPDISAYIAQLVETAVDDTARLVLGGHYQGQPAIDAAMLAIQPSLDQMKDDLNKKSDDYTQRYFTKPVKDMVRVMPKQELATLAESLIEITSLRRKVTRDQETVGGDVDVAIISKSEGFVWTKRKLYFPKELNPRFFVRHYPEAAP